MFSFLKDKFSKIYNKITSGIASLLGSNNQWNDQTKKQLEKILLESEFGSQMTRSIVDHLENNFKSSDKENFNIQKTLASYLYEILAKPEAFKENDGIYFLCGVNGSGKTTTAIKLARHFSMQGKKTLLVAADTFRAAAREQLEFQARENGFDFFKGEENDSPASVVFKACEKAHTYDRIIVDTAGRLQSKDNLMHELAKIERVAEKASPEKKKFFMLVLDSTIGQNALDQATIFNQAVSVKSLILTKFDALTKPGTIFSIVNNLNVPVSYITYGESKEFLDEFSSEALVQRIVYE